ncbi:hypothetical protein B0T14DRAFT_312364 [Immersiella caudata]|uniref:Uncharacterized protein n=1 Tax=Immersiella caudata TaxID=314043 RepID=A0AA40BV05_9PEZI|nr:hypothetical protein B0T14DRAFT_312364 [Immersiella caudata]
MYGYQQSMEVEGFEPKGLGEDSPECLAHYRSVYNDMMERYGAETTKLGETGQLCRMSLITENLGSHRSAQTSMPKWDSVVDIAVMETLWKGFDALLSKKKASRGPGQRCTAVHGIQNRTGNYQVRSFTSPREIEIWYERDPFVRQIQASGWLRGRNKNTQCQHTSSAGICCQDDASAITHNWDHWRHRGSLGSCINYESGAARHNDLPKSEKFRLGLSRPPRICSSSHCTDPPLKRNTT